MWYRVVSTGLCSIGLCGVGLCNTIDTITDSIYGSIELCPDASIVIMPRCVIVQEMETKYTTAIAIARKHLSRSLVEERAWYCNFVGMFNNVMVCY